MRKVIHQYGVELDWMPEMARQLDSQLLDHVIKVPDQFQSGLRYACPITDQLTVFVIDVTYHEDVLYSLRNNKNDFVGLYFNLTEGDAIHVMDKVSRPVGRWSHNLALIDSTLPGDYMVKAGSRTYMLSIFIKKKALQEYLDRIPNRPAVSNAIFDQDLNTIIRFDRMSNQAWWLMNEMRKIPFGTPLYDVFLKGTVYGLLSDYLGQLVKQEVLIEKVFQEDIIQIISVQAYLIENIKAHFPGISMLASKACMSESKFKRLFKKITGMSPNAFFLSNKLSFAREMLESGDYTVSEVALAFNFFDASHLIEQFKHNYQITPKDYLNFL